MPEIKNNFLQGKMNKDLDERLIPNGQYREAMNVEISTAEDSSVGTVKNILGNRRVENIIPTGFVCVGSMANEKTNMIYWFISKHDSTNEISVDAIIEYDTDNNITTPVFVDTKASTSEAVLKLSGDLITGINIIDDMLFWTDNSSEPKKINISECKSGTNIDGVTNDFTKHTKLLFETGSFNGITLRVLTEGTSPSSANWDSNNRPIAKFGRYFWHQNNQLQSIFHRPLVWADSNWSSPYEQYLINQYRNGEFYTQRRIKVWDDENNPNNHGSTARIDPYQFTPSNSSYPGFPDPNGNQIIENGKYSFFMEDIIFGANNPIDIQERHITVIKPKPTNRFSTKINYTENLEGTTNIPNLFETKFPRFSYRYKYRDGEFSSIAPFTEPVFNPKYTKDVNKSNNTNVLNNKDTIYDIKEPYNKAMVNSIHSVELTDFITPETPENIVEIDILYKQEDSPVIYSIHTIKHTDPEWHDVSNNEGHNIGFGKAKNNVGYHALGGLVKGKYIVTTENIYAALPANQLLRPWDNVPRRALAQEVTGNRLVYGNYLQNYNLYITPKVNVSYSARKNLESFENKGLPSIKSQRNYQVGVVFCDKYGRETPVFTSRTGATSIPWQDGDGYKNASKSLQLNASVVKNFPEWVDSLKFFVKETSNEYYNLVMDRAWVTKKTYELDNSEGHLWISFPSSDRNKVSEEDYIILKKKIGTGEEQIGFENKFKIIDIQNEAPDALKHELVMFGSAINDSDFLTDTTIDGLKMPVTASTNSRGRIDHAGSTNIQFHKSNWKWGSATGGMVFGNSPLEDNADDNIMSESFKDLYVSWRRDEANDKSSSKKYRVLSGRTSTTAYVLRLATPISKEDADIAHETGDSSTLYNAKLRDKLVFQIEKKVLKDNEDFSGKFFVKISENQVTDLITGTNTNDILSQYLIDKKFASWYWEDDCFNVGYPDTSVIAQHSLTSLGPGTGYGNGNHSGFKQGNTSGSDGIQNSANNAVGNDNADSVTLRVTDYWKAWEGILTKFGGPQFFVDSMYMASGQSEASDYAKYNCITWSGSDKNDGETREDSGWYYPPLKTWLTDFTKKAEFLETVSDIIDQQTESHSGTNTAPTNTIPLESMWYEGNLISTSPEINPNVDWGDQGVDGWVGGLQLVDRFHQQTGTRSNYHVNGLEGFVTTSSLHATGIRRWFSGITGNPTENGVGVDTKTYSDKGEVGRHFMHLSFFAPGKDLHDSNWNGTNGVTAGLSSGRLLYGAEAFMGNLQGIWGGGHFTVDSPNATLGSGTVKHQHLAMEGNYADNNSFLPEPAGPGVGYGYDINYKELHERQWDPTFNAGGDPDNKIRDFIRKLVPGSRFKFIKDTTNNTTTRLGENLTIGLLVVVVLRV